LATYGEQTAVRITAEHLFLHLPVFNINSLSLKKHLLRLGLRGRIQFNAKVAVVEALRDVSFEIAEGDGVGIVGLNGAGKTTLLRTLAGIYKPTAGRLSAVGKVVPMLTTGVGMYDDASGYDNILYGGVHIGMTPEEIAAKRDEIAAFTELGEYLYLPLYSYSTGMKTRLNFAIATAVGADILLLDEIIGAGDAAFKNKAKKRFDQFIRQSRIFVLASHDEGLIRDYCNKTMLLHQGELLAFGSTADVLAEYHDLVQRQEP